jgi:hypothetical protein
MPQIIVVADSGADRQDRAVMFTERVSVRDFESRHFQTQLVERLGWAVGDAHHAEQSSAPAEQTKPSAWEEHPASDRQRERRSVSDAQPVS